jgi:hypothetical protein
VSASALANEAARRSGRDDGKPRTEVRLGQDLDNGFHNTDVISRSGMAPITKDQPIRVRLEE